MREGTWRAAVAALALASAGCYHARVETGAAPSDVVVTQSMASSWLWGLVPPSLTNVSAQCPAGVSRVETKHTVLNGLVHILTGGIYTPMTIIVTCAKAGTTAAVPDGALVAPQLPDAVQLSRDTRRPVYLRAR